MGEIVFRGSIGAKALENISGVTKIENSDKVFVSTCGPKKLKSYKWDCGKLHSDDNCTDLYDCDIKHISSNSNLLFIVPNKKFKVVCVDPCTKNRTYLKVYNKLSCSYDDLSRYVLDPILKSRYRKHCSSNNFCLVAFLVVEHNAYFFVQSESTEKHNSNLFVVKGELNEDCLSLNSCFELQTFFNLYRNGKKAKLSNEDAKTVMCDGVTYDHCNNVFVLLMVYGNNYEHGYLCKLYRFDRLHGLGTSLWVVKKACDKNHTLKLNHSPRGITYVGNGKFLILSNDFKTKHVKHGKHKKTKKYVSYCTVALCKE